MMATMRDEIVEGFGRVVAEVCPPDRVHAIEGGADHSALWETLEESGFLDALVPEAAGGVGLSIHDAAPIAELAGQYAVPVPLAETVVIRGLLAAAGIERPQGSIAFGARAHEEDGGTVCRGIIEGARADHVLTAFGDGWRLLPTADATVVQPGLEATLRWDAAMSDATRTVAPAIDPQVAEALTRALQLAGALGAVLERTLGYANDRQQFGRPIGKFQAIQHQLAIMAEHVFAARMAAEVAATRGDFAIDPLRTAIAKARASEAAAEVAALSHSIHGAIGFTREYDLQLHTRRLHAWRRAAGAEGYWQQRIGAGLIAHPGPSLDFLRQLTDIPPQSRSL